MGLSVPGLIHCRIREAKIRAEINDFGGQCRKSLKARSGLSMGQAKKEHIAGLQLRQRAKLELTGLSKVWVRSVQRLSREPLRRHLLDGALGMKKQKTNKLAARVT